MILSKENPDVLRNGKLLAEQLRLEIHSARRGLAKWRRTWDGETTHVDPYARLYWVLYGEAEVQVGDERFKLARGHLCLLPAKTPVKMFSPAENMDHYWVHFSSTLQQGVCLFDLFDFPRVLVGDEVGVSPTVFDVIKSTFGSDNFGEATRGQAALREALVPFFSKARSKRSYDEWLHLKFFQPAIDFVERNLPGGVKVPAMARTVGLHPNYFSEKFKNCFGLPPRKYICLRRIERAQNLLVHTKLTLKEISVRVGYEDEFHFAKLFKKYIGVSPGIYRKRHV